MSPAQVLIRGISILSILLVIVSCGSKKSSDTGFINYEKWTIQEPYQAMPLKGSPRMVLDSFFFITGDTSIAANVMFTHYRIVQFDSAGNVLIRRDFSDSTNVSEELSSYSWEGMQTSYVKYEKFPDSIKQAEASMTKWAREKENVYRSIPAPDKDSGQKISVLLRFLPEENARRYEQWTGNKMTYSMTLFYKDGMLMRIKTEGGGSSDKIYYRSVNGYLDSVVFTIDGKATDKSIYVNNDHGDVILYKQQSRFNPPIETRFEYSYDEMGNWRRRLCKSQATLIKRVIAY